MRDKNPKLTRIIFRGQIITKINKRHNMSGSDATMGKNKGRKEREKIAT